MNKVVLVLIALTAFCFAERPQRSSPFDGPPPQRDTIFVVVSAGDTTPKEYSIISPGNEEYTVTRKTGETVTHGLPPMKAVSTGENIKIILSPKLVGAPGSLRDLKDSLIWKGKVPKSQELEINTSGWKQGKYYGGISDYKFGIIKE
jgi:hypothetical protein